MGELVCFQNEIGKRYLAVAHVVWNCTKIRRPQMGIRIKHNFWICTSTCCHPEYSHTHLDMALQGLTSCPSTPSDDNLIKHMRHIEQLEWKGNHCAVVALFLKKALHSFSHHTNYSRRLDWFPMKS